MSDDWEQTVPTDSGLAVLADLVKDLAAQTAEVEDLTERLSAAKKVAEHTSRVTIPEMMDSLGITGKLTTKDGLSIEVKNVVRASIKDANRSAAIGWLTDNGYERLITHEFKVKLKKNSWDRAKGISETLDQMGVPYEDKKGVHHSALSAFVRELGRDGKPVPDDVLGVYRYSETKIK